MPTSKAALVPPFAGHSGALGSAEGRAQRLEIFPFSQMLTFSLPPCPHGKLKLPPPHFPLQSGEDPAAISAYRSLSGKPVQPTLVTFPPSTIFPDSFQHTQSAAGTPGHSEAWKDPHKLWVVPFTRSFQSDPGPLGLRTLSHNTSSFLCLGESALESENEEV